jgi:hypothetical protein
MASYAITLCFTLITKNNGDKVETELRIISPEDEGPDITAAPQCRNPSHNVNAEGMKHLGRMQKTR